LPLRGGKERGKREEEEGKSKGRKETEKIGENNVVVVVNARPRRP